MVGSPPATSPSFQDSLFPACDLNGMTTIMASETSKEAGNDSKPGAVQYHDSALDHKIREVVPIPEEMEISIPVVPKYSPKTTSMRSPRSPGLSIAIARKMHIDHDITLPPSAYTSPLREELLSSKEQRNSFDDPEEARDSFSDIGPTSHLASSSVVFDFSSDDAGESLESDPAIRDALHHHITSPGSSDGGDHYSTLGKNLFGKFWKKHFPKMNHHGDGELYRSHSGEHLTSVLANAGDSPTPEDSDDLMSPPSERALDASPRPRGQSHGLFDLFWQHRMDNENSVKHSHPRKSKSRRNQSSEDHGIKRNANSSDHLKHSKMDSDEEHHGRDSKSARDSKSDSRNLFENIFHPEHSSRRESSDGSSGGSSPLPSVSGHHFHTHITKKDLDDHKKKESISGRSGRTGSVSHSTRNASETSLDKYGFKDSVVGKGAQATVRLVIKVKLGTQKGKRIEIVRHQRV